MCWQPYRQSCYSHIHTDIANNVTKHDCLSYAGVYMYAMQEQNLATGKGLVFTRWTWFTNPLHAVGQLWSACFVLAVLRMTTTTLVSTW